MSLHAPPQSNAFCWHPGGLELTKHALDLCPMPKGAKILDVGSGAGHSIKLMQELGFTAYGLDLHYPSNIDQHNLALTPPLPHIMANAINLPFKGNSFEAIVCECVLSVIPNKLQALQEFWRICNGISKQAYLIINDVYTKDNNDREQLSHKQLQKDLQKSHWRLEHFEDHTKSLRTFAAQLLWHNLEPCQLDKVNLGYGLWIAIKDNK